MVSKEQIVVALNLCLLWVLAVTTAYFLGLELHWFVVLLSLLFLILGWLVLFRGFQIIRLCFPFVLASKEDLPAYNKERFSRILGIPTVALSYVILFVSAGVLMLLPLLGIAIALQVAILYVYAVS
jgi:hypothetical protein